MSRAGWAPGEGGCAWRGGCPGTASTLLGLTPSIRRSSQLLALRPVGAVGQVGVTRAPPTGPHRGPHVSAAKATVMPHFLDWFVPVYLVISVLILVGFGACIYYFEPGLQEAHKWRMQRPLVDRDLRKTLMVRDNLAFGGPEV